MGPANKAPTGSGKRTRVPRGAGGSRLGPGSHTHRCRGSRRWSSPGQREATTPGVAVAISGTRDGADPGSVSSTTMSQPSSEATAASHPPCRVGRLGPEHSNHVDARVGEEDVYHPAPHVACGADRHPQPEPPPSSGSTARHPSFRLGAGAAAMVRQRPTTTARVRAAAVISNLRKFTSGVYGPRTLHRPVALRWHGPGQSRGTPAVFPTGEGAEAKPVGIRRCPATVMPQTWGRARSPATGGHDVLSVEGRVVPSYDIQPSDERRRTADEEMAFRNGVPGDARGRV